MDISFQEYKLNNGLSVILHEDHHVPIVAVNVWYHVGSKNEVTGKTGFAHLFEHMMFQGSANVGPDMHFKLIQSVGGQLNGSTFFDRTNYFETLPSHYLELGLWLESDRMGFLLPAMTTEKLNNQRDVVKNERRQRYDNQPYGLWFEHILALAYPREFPYHWPVIGYMEDIDRAGTEDINQFFREYYQPANASLVLCGDFDSERALKLVRRYFEDIPNLAAKPVFDKAFIPERLAEKRRVIRDHVQLARLHWAYHVPAYGHSDFYALDILTDILSDGRSSRLYHELIVRRELVQDAQAFLLGMEDTSLLFFISTPRPGTSLEIVEEALEAQIEALKKDGPSTFEMEKSINQLVSRKLRSLQTMAGRADQLNSFKTFFNDAGLINREIDHYERVTADDIRRAAQYYLIPENRVTVNYVPESGEK